MHIMEGYLPPVHAALWTGVSGPLVAYGLYRIKKQIRTPEEKLKLAAAGAFSFLLSSLKLPSVTGSSSHATGTGAAALLYGPHPATIVGSLVLLFQALLLAHGGITTLGANIFSMAVAGPWVAYLLYRSLQGLSFPRELSLFLAAAAGDLATYAVTSLQLALAFPDATGGMLGSFIKFFSIFSVTQVPLALSEGVLTVLFFRLVKGDSLPSLLVSEKKGELKQ